jgi:ribose-phosphate pyrophosphokinase
MDGWEDLVVVSNKSASELRDRVVQNLQMNLERKVRHKFSELQRNNTFSKYFPSGEKYVQLKSNARKRDVHVIASFHDPDLYFDRRDIVNSNMSFERKCRLIENYHSLEPDFRELEKICDSARRSGAREINVYFTYYPDGRQDKKDEPHVPIAAKLTMDNLTSSAEPRLGRIGVLDLHAAQEQGFTNYPVDEIKARYIFLAQLKLEFGSFDPIIVVFADGGSHSRLEKDLKRYGLKYAIVGKSRPKHSESTVEHFIGHNPKGLVAVIIDDMVDGGGTTLGAADAVGIYEPKEIRSYSTHFIASTKVVKDEEDNPKEIVFTEDRFRKSGIKAFAFDSISRTEKYLSEHKDWLTFFTSAPLIAELIYCNHSGSSYGDQIAEYKNLVDKASEKELAKSLGKFLIL